MVVLTAPLIDGVEDEGDELRVGAARVPFWAGCSSQPQPNSRLSFPRTTYVTIVGLEDLSNPTKGLRVVPDSSPAHAFLDRDYRSLPYRV